MHRRDFEALPARLAHHLVVDSNQVVAQLRELGAISLVGARRQLVLLLTPDPSHGVFIGTAAARTRQPFVSLFVFVEKERALV
jgi:hypothetical protein